MFSLWCVKPALVLYMWLEINLHVVSIILMLEAWQVPVSAHVCIFVMYNIKWPLRKLIGGSKMTHFLVEHTNQQFYSVWISWIMSDFIFFDMHSIFTGLGGNISLSAIRKMRKMWGIGPLITVVFNCIVKLTNH